MNNQNLFANQKADIYCDIFFDEQLISTIHPTILNPGFPVAEHLYPILSVTITVWFEIQSEYSPENGFGFQFS